MLETQNGLRPCAVALAVALTLGLTGCGGGGGSGANVRPTPSSPPPPPAGGSDFAGGNVNVGSGDTLVWPANISGSINLIKGGGGTLMLTGTDNYTGGTTISSGTLQLGNGSTTGSITGDVTNNGTLVFDRSDSLSFTGVVSGSGSVTQAGTGTLTLTGSNTYTGGTTISAGTLQLGNGGTTGWIVGNVTGSGTLVFNRSDAVSFGGVISGSGSLTQAGTSTLTLTGMNTYTGATTISAGTLALTGSGSVASSSGVIANGTFDISGTNNGATIASLSGNSTVALGARTLMLSNATGTFGGVIGGAGGLVLTGGTEIFTGANTYTGGTTISSGTLQLGNGGTTGSIVGDVNDNGTLIFDRSDDVNFAGTITGVGSLVKTGSGALILTGANGYTGVTQVDAGSLYVDGNQSATTGATTVANGATLGGTGILGGDVAVADGATLAPGSKGAIGTLTVNGDLSLSAGSTLDYSFGQVGMANVQSSNLINVKGNLTLGGTLNVSVAPGGELGPGVYRLINYNGTLVNNGLTLSSGSSGLLVQTGVAQQVSLINTQGMAFSFWDGDAGPKNNDVVNGGNGTWQSGNPLSNTNWTDVRGAVNTFFSDRSFAVFQATPGTVTVDSGNGDINAAGMQFASNGYVIQGDTIHLVGSADDPAHSIIRVGDGTVAGAGYTATINSVLSGNSALVKTDAGTLVLGGNNTYTGGTTINSGALQLGNGGTTGSITGNVTDNGSLVFNRSDDVSFGGVISGSGSLTQAGTGTLTLTGANTYTGGTTISSGILQLGDGIHTGSIAGNITDNASLVFDPGGDLSYTGAISGSGSLVKAGEGTLKLAGVSTYTGGTSVNGGVLEIMPGAVPGTDSITVIGSLSYVSPNILEVDSGVSLTNQIVLEGSGMLNNAGKLSSTYGVAVRGPGPFATIVNHDGGNIKGNGSAAEFAYYGTVDNGSGGVIEGGDFGIVMSIGGKISNDGAGSIIRSKNGMAIQVSGEVGTVGNTGGGTIISSLTPIYLQHGGTVTNGAGSIIEATGARNGDCGGAGVCSIFVASGDSTVSTFDGGLTLSNAGSIIGNVQMIPAARNYVTLSAGGSIQGDLLMGSNSASLLMLNGDAGTVQLYSQAVTGTTTFAGLFRKSGDGTWIVDTDDLGAVAHTEIQSGTLQVGDGGVSGSIGSSIVQIYGGATLAFDRSDDVVFAGLIAGNGSGAHHASLVQAGTGKLTLTDMRSIGPWMDLVIQKGSVKLGDGGLYPGYISGFDISNNGALILDFDGQVIFDSAISGAGSLTKQGPGTLILGLAGSNYTGGTTVDGGTLRATSFLYGNATVNQGAVLAGAATDHTPLGLRNVIGNLANAGTVVVSNGTAVVVGDYSHAPTGTLAVSLGSKLAADGAATLNGGTLEVTGADRGYISNTHTEVLTARNGVSGTFDRLVKDTGVVFTATTINYDANSVWLDTTGLNVTTAAAGSGVSYTPASMGSARRVQGAFEQLDSKVAAGNLSGVSGDFLQAAGQFQQSPTLQAAQASLQSLSGELHAASAALTFEAIDASSRALSDRFDTLLGKGTGFGMWTQSLNMGGDMARAGYDGVGFQLNGWLVGSDRQIGRSGVAGFAFGQSQGLQQANQGFGRDNSRSTEGMLYAGWLNGNWYTQGRIGFGHFQQDVNRQILLGHSAQAVSTQYSGNYSVAYGESGLHLSYGGGRVTPFVNVEYASIDRGGFVEQGAGGFGLRSDAQALDRWQAGLGVRADRHWDLGDGRAVNLSARAQWQRTLASHGDVLDASFVGLQQWQPLTGIGLSRYSGLFGVGLDATLSARTSLNFGYDYEMGQRDSAQMLSARLNVAF